MRSPRFSQDHRSFVVLRKSVQAKPLACSRLNLGDEFFLAASFAISRFTHTRVSIGPVHISEARPLAYLAFGGARRSAYGQEICRGVLRLGGPTTFRGLPRCGSILSRACANRSHPKSCSCLLSVQVKKNGDAKTERILYSQEFSLSKKRMNGKT